MKAFIIALALMSVFLLFAPRPRPLAIVSTALPARAPTPTMIEPPTFAPVATQAATVSLDNALDIIGDDGLTIDESGTREALRYVVERFGSGPSAPFHAVYSADQDCFLRGVAHTEERSVQTMTCNSISTRRAVVIMSHEFVHQLAQDRYGPAHLSADLILAEGVATWGAGAYWLSSAADFRSYVRNAGVQYPLAQSYEGLGVNAQNAMYYQWASFVEFLITGYGREKFDQVYVTGKGAPGSADYQSIYGEDISALEAEWKGWIQQ